MDEDEKHKQLSDLADKFGKTIQQLTGADSAIIFYAYHTIENGTPHWRRGSQGNADMYQRMGFVEELRNDLINLDQDESS